MAGFCSLSNKVYGISSKIGGASSDDLYNKYAGQFVNQDLEIVKRDVYKSTELRIQNKEKLPGVNILTTREECEKCC